MQLLVDEAFAHVEIPDADCAVLVDYRSQVFHAFLCIEKANLWVRRLVAAEADFVHLTEVGTIDFANERLAPDVPKLDGFVHADGDGE